MRRSSLMLGAAVILLCSVPAGAGANDAGLRTTLDTWAKKIGMDANSVALAGRQRHPIRMTYSANRFHNDALRAKAAVAVQKPSTSTGRQARQLALKAFADYALAGSDWAAAGRARLAHERAASIKNANAGATYARSGSMLLISAGKLLH